MLQPTTSWNDTQKLLAFVIVVAFITVIFVWMFFAPKSDAAATAVLNTLVGALAGYTGTVIMVLFPAIVVPAPTRTRPLPIWPIRQRRQFPPAPPPTPPAPMMLLAGFIMLHAVDSGVIWLNGSSVVAMWAPHCRS